MGHKKFPYINIRGVKLSQAGPISLFNPVSLSTSFSHLLYSRIPIGLWGRLSGIVVRLSVYDTIVSSIPYMLKKVDGPVGIVGFLACQEFILQEHTYQ